jgi:hypothetical protein
MSQQFPAAVAAGVEHREPGVGVAVQMAQQGDALAVET